MQAIWKRFPTTEFFNAFIFILRKGSIFLKYLFPVGVEYFSQKQLGGAQRQRCSGICLVLKNLRFKIPKKYSQVKFFLIFISNRSNEMFPANVLLELLCFCHSTVEQQCGALPQPGYCACKKEN